MARLVVEYTVGDYECSSDIVRCVTAPSRDAFLEDLANKMQAIVTKFNETNDERLSRLEQMSKLQKKLTDHYLRDSRHKPLNKPLTVKQQKRQKETSQEADTVLAEFKQLQDAARQDQPIPPHVEVYGLKLNPHDFLTYTEDYKILVGHTPPDVSELDDWFNTKVGE
jgi:hypothetical protein